MKCVARKKKRLLIFVCISGTMLMMYFNVKCTKKKKTAESFTERDNPDAFISIPKQKIFSYLGPRRIEDSATTLSAQEVIDIIRNYKAEYVANLELQTDDPEASISNQKQIIFSYLASRNREDLSSKFSIQRKTESDFNFMINEESMCSERDGAHIVLLVVVYLTVDDLEERNYIRSTWGAVARTNPKIRLLFMLGRPVNRETNSTESSIRLESSIHHGIVQGDFADTYRKLLLKTYAFFQWVSLYCSNIQYVLKIDCDMQIDLTHLVHILEQKYIPSQFICGEIRNNTWVNRGIGTRWDISPELYPNAKYSLYCTGSTYIIPRRIVMRYSTLPVPNHPFPLDDVFITGFLRQWLNESAAHGVIKFRHHFNSTRPG